MRFGVNNFGFFRCIHLEELIGISFIRFITGLVLLLKLLCLVFLFLYGKLPLRLIRLIVLFRIARLRLGWFGLIVLCRFSSVFAGIFLKPHLLELFQRLSDFVWDFQV